MIPELTIGYAAALMCGVIGLLYLSSAFRNAFLDEAIIGCVWLLVAWWVLQL